MEAQGEAGVSEAKKDTQKPLKTSKSEDLAKQVKEATHHLVCDEEGGIPGYNPSLLHLMERRQPLSSVSSLEVHFDLLDLTELTDTSDQELAEVFVDSEDENHQSPVSQQHHHPFLPRGGGSWICCSKGEAASDKQHHRESDSTKPQLKMDHPEQPAALRGCGQRRSEDTETDNNTAQQ
ncbi:dysbindin domain-containing protein 1-like isoform X1 [Denticeps clupeoides]|uniref:Dysbindin domain-containing protein 1 n=1 Tax=Denticeps clupeoides TaxID=299321 RepID=A0AAY4BMB2_9TELE|nr:dysbindin domain-containing protein 1-like isoform X1 [Denticeps clupeoides]